MPIAAVPAYLGYDFSHASPGLRFGLLLPIWTDRQDQEADVNARAQRQSPEGQQVADVLRRQGMDTAIETLLQASRNPLARLWDKNDFAAKQAWDAIKKFSQADQKRMEALADRQSTFAVALPAEHYLRIDATAIAPFTTGLGNEHPLENGFAFLNPYGLPYLPGSGVKGVLRQAARELASGEWDDTHGWSDALLPSPASGRGAGGEGISMLDALFGKESKNGETDHLRGALSFWDVIPQIKGDSLLVEILTPHQGHYYAQKLDAKTGNSTSPHDSGQPIPNCFLTVPPGSGFAFYVVCDTAHLARHTPTLVEMDNATGKPRWQAPLIAAFKHAFEWLGFGAKTAVGYGAMRRDEEAEAKAQIALDTAISAAEEQRKKAQQDIDEEIILAAMTDAGRNIYLFIKFMRNRYDSLQGKPVRANGDDHNRARTLANTALESPDWTLDEKRSAAEAITEWLPKVVAVDMKNERKKLKLAVLRGEV